MKRFVGCWILFFIVFFFVSFIKHSECLSSDNKITLPKTGQTETYATGDDGDLQKGAAWPEERFTVGTGDEEDCVTDNLTGLMWAKNGNLPDEAKIWQDALEYVKNTTNSSPGLCHYTDWRLPNVNELASLINYGFNDGALCNNSPCDNLADWLNSSSFENVKNNNYWTSTTSASGSGNAWLVNMSDGVLTAGSKSDVNYVWAVRSILNDFTLTITKSGTGTGTVTSEPSGINCGSTCSKNFKENKNVTLTASAGDGSTFAGWSGSGCSGTGSCTVTMNSEKSVTATFNQHSTPPPPPLTCT